MQPTPSQGSITDIFFPRLVARLQHQEFEGALRVAVGETGKVLYFKRGEIASAASNAEADRLATVLIGEARLTQAQLDLAKARVTPGGSLGKTLIEMGFLTPAELLQGARLQVRQILVSCFGLSSGTWAIEPGPLPPEVTVLGLPTRRMIFDAILQSGNRQWIVREMGSMESVYRPTERLAAGLAVLKIEPEMDRVARMLDGSQSLRDLSGRTSLDDFTVSKIVLALDILGLAELVGAPVPARPVEGRAFAAAARPEPAAAPGPVPGGSPGDVEALAPEEEPRPPAGELPAFAIPPDGEEGWQVDPQTGERVHVGPIEVTFEGRVKAPRHARRLPLLVLGGCALSVLAAIGFVAWRRGASSSTRAVEATPQRTDAGAAVTTPAAEPALAPASAPTPAPAPTGIATDRAPAPPAPRGSVSPFREAGRYAIALARLDGGDPAGAAGLFQNLLATEPPGRFTLQLMIACEEASLRSARHGSGEGGSLFILPFRFRERDCYRACWGLYPSKEAAREASGSLPPFLSGGGIEPVIVSIERLRSTP